MRFTKQHTPFTRAMLNPFFTLGFVSALSNVAPSWAKASHREIVKWLALVPGEGYSITLIDESRHMILNLTVCGEYDYRLCFAHTSFARRNLMWLEQDGTASFDTEDLNSATLVQLEWSGRFEGGVNNVIPAPTDWTHETIAKFLIALHAKMRLHAHAAHAALMEQARQYALIINGE